MTSKTDVHLILSLRPSEQTTYENAGHFVGSGILDKFGRTETERAAAENRQNASRELTIRVDDDNDRLIVTDDDGTNKSSGEKSVPISPEAVGKRALDAAASVGAPPGPHVVGIVAPPVIFPIADRDARAVKDFFDRTYGAQLDHSLKENGDSVNILLDCSEMSHYALEELLNLHHHPADKISIYVPFGWQLTVACTLLTGKHNIRVLYRGATESECAREISRRCDTLISFIPALHLLAPALTAVVGKTAMQTLMQYAMPKWLDEAVCEDISFVYQSTYVRRNNVGPLGIVHPDQDRLKQRYGLALPRVGAMTTATSVPKSTTTAGTVPTFTSPMHTASDQRVAFRETGRINSDYFDPIVLDERTEGSVAATTTTTTTTTTAAVVVQPQQQLPPQTGLVTRIVPVEDEEDSDDIPLKSTRAVKPLANHLEKQTSATSKNKRPNSEVVSKTDAAEEKSWTKKRKLISRSRKAVDNSTRILGEIQISPRSVEQEGEVTSADREFVVDDTDDEDDDDDEEYENKDDSDEDRKEGAAEQLETSSLKSAVRQRQQALQKRFMIVSSQDLVDYANDAEQPEGDRAVSFDADSIDSMPESRTATPLFWARFVESCSHADQITSWPATMWFKQMSEPISMLMQKGRMPKSRRLQLLAALAYFGRVEVRPFDTVDEDELDDLVLTTCALCGKKNCRNNRVVVTVHGPISDSHKTAIDREFRGSTTDDTGDDDYVAMIEKSTAELNMSSVSSKPTVVAKTLPKHASPAYEVSMIFGSSCSDLALRIVFLFSTLCDIRRRVLPLAIAGDVGDPIINLLCTIRARDRVADAYYAIVDHNASELVHHGYNGGPTSWMHIGRNTPALITQQPKKANNNNNDDESEVLF